MQEGPGPVRFRDFFNHIDDFRQFLLVEPVERLRFASSPKYFAQQRHAFRSIHQRLLTEVDKHHRHTSPFQLVDQQLIAGSGAVPLKAEDGQVSPQGEHAFQAETVG